MLIWLLIMTNWSGDILFTNAHITTLEDEQPTASVIWVHDGRIHQIGDTVPENMDATPKIDLEGAYVLPGLIDAHAHLRSLGSSMDRIDLRGTTSYQQVIDRVVERAATTPKGTWIVGRGWDQNDWQEKAFPVHGPLSNASPDHPVCLTRIDGHAALLNATALQLLGLDSSVADPPGGSFIRISGQLTGVLVDEAMAHIDIPEPQGSNLALQLRKAAEFAASQGLTGVHEAGVDSRTLRALEQLAEKGQLSVRTYNMLSGSSLPTLDEELPKGPRTGESNGFITVRCIKVYADGALGSRGAWLKAPYSDDPNNHGLPQIEPNQFDALIDRAMDAGFQVATHAIGDRGNHFVLTHYARALDRARLAGKELKDPRLRVEHAQILDLNDVSLFKEHGILPSMQPTHCTSDMPWVPDRLGATRTKGAYIWRTLLDAGLKIPMGSDFPIEKVSPWDGLYAAVTRQDHRGQPPTGFMPEQRLTRKEALLGFTLWAAYGAFAEDDLGSLRPGKYADFVVIDRDYFTIPVIDIPNIKVLRTVVGGKSVYQR